MMILPARKSIKASSMVFNVIGSDILLVKHADA